ncbi:Ig-like domain-containing protein [Candidatus Ruthia endofausta]|uniref:Ig-like domain-containing protein n=1 Tax=Candidatus Ruthia endofausta TaxID=2738852 RepID=A0A6N0HN41_9GAMM|nr:Ig-like domain-containing protein [Candidatus Ruthia endofausta]QKQ23740.1 Ig-like domain-containing protein [Candidatus Ruthia endofausta]
MQTQAQVLSQTLSKEVVVVTKGEQHIRVVPNRAYELSIEDGKDFDLIAKKVGDDLEVLLPNDTTVVFDGYFEVCASDLSCLVSLPSEGGIYYVVEGNFVTLADSSQIIHFYGDESALSAIATYQSSLFSESFSEVYLIGFFSSLSIGSGEILGGSAGVDGGDISSLGDVVLQIVASAGEFIENNGGLVKLYKYNPATGKLNFFTDVDLNNSGAQDFSIGSYEGIIVAKLIDTNGDNADFRDEATGVDTDISAILLAVIDTSKGGNIDVSITPLTTIAALRMDLTTSGELPTGVMLDASTINNTNKGVAKAFGLGNDADVVTTRVQTVTTQDGETSTSNAYGNALAALSGVDSEKNSGDMAATITQFEEELTGTGADLKLTRNGQEDLLAGASKAETSNSKIDVASGLAAAIKSTDAIDSFSGIEIMLGFEDTGTSATDDIVQAIDADDNPTVGTVATGNIRINVVGVGSDWFYSTNDGVGWTQGVTDAELGVGFNLAENANAYNKEHIMVRPTGSLSGKDGTEVILGTGTILVDGEAPNGATSTALSSSTASVIDVAIATGNTWQYSTENGADGTWKVGVGTSFSLAANVVHAANQIQVKEIDAAGNESTILKNAVEITGSSLALNLNSDTGNDIFDGKTKDATINVITGSNVTWEFTINGGTDWNPGDTGNGSFELLIPGQETGDILQSNIKVKVAGQDDSNAVTLSHYDVASIDVSTLTIDATLTLASDGDTGTAGDKITGNKVINVTGGGIWEYSTDSGGNWKKGSGSSFELSSQSYVQGQVQVKKVDEYDNDSQSTLLNAITIDYISPSVILFTSSTVGGSHGVGSKINITATVSEEITSGAITVTLNTGETVTLIVSADDKTLLTGDYTVNTNDATTDLKVASFSISSIIVDIAGNEMTGTRVPDKNISDNIEASDSAILIDGVAPTITSFISTTADNSYKAGSEINITATVSESIKAGGKITVTLNSGGAAVLTIAAGGASLTGTYTIGSSDNTADLSVVSFVIGTEADAVIDVTGNAMTSNTLPSGSNISDISAIVVDTTAPTATLSSNIAPVVNLIMTFDADVTKIDGKEIKIHKVGEATAVHTTIIGNDVTGTVSITDNRVTIDPIVDLEPNTDYYVTIETGTFKDIAGNEYAGITDAADWAFTAAALTTSAIWSNSSTDVSSNGINIAEFGALSIKGILSNIGDAATGVTIDRIVFKAASGSDNDITYSGGMPTLSGDTNESTWELMHANILTLSLVDGETYTIEVSLTASGGITGSGGSSTQVLIDQTAPTIPTINTIARDDVINFSEKNSAITGTSEANSTITLSIGGNTRIAAVTGITWSYTLTDADITAMGQGSESITATATDINNIATSSAKSITVATVAPTITSVTDDHDQSGQEVTSGIVIYTVTFSHGVNSSFTSNDVVLVDNSGEVIDTMDRVIGILTELSGSSGTQWTVSVTPPSGFNAIDVTAVRLKIKKTGLTDIYGNDPFDINHTQDIADAQSFDTQPPSDPILTLNTDTGTSATDGITNNGVMDVTNLAVDLASWQYSIDGGVNWATVSDSVVTSFTLAAGTYGVNLIRVRQTDNAGQTSNITKYITDITVDTSIDTPTLAPADGGTMSSTDSFVLTFAENMNAVIGKSIVIKCFSDDTVIEAITADSGIQVSINAAGVVTINPTDIKLVAGTSYYVEIDAGAFKDTAGNESTAITGSTAWNVTVNEMDVIIAVATDNKVNAIENATDITIAVTISSTSAILGALLLGDFSVTATKVSDSSNVVFTGATYDNATGIWTATISDGGLINGDSYTIQSDVTGSVLNINASSTQTVRVDTDVPILSLTGNIAIDNVINIAESASGFSITGTSTGLAIGREMSIVLNTQTYTTTVTDVSGSWDVNIPSTDASALMEGTTYAVTVNASDDYGNPATQLSQDITVDKTAPVSTVVIDEVITDLPTITGQTSASIAVEIKLDTDNDNSYDDVTYTVTSDTTGNWTLDLTSVASLISGIASTFASIDTQLGVQVSITDAAGNMTTRTGIATKQDSSYSISDSRVIEGITGRKTMTFMVTREGGLSAAGTVDYAVDTTLSLAKSGGTADGIDDDYSVDGDGDVSGTVTFAAGESFKEITFIVNGDYYKEVNQNIIVDLTNPTEGAISKATGIGEISEVDVSAMSGAFSLKDINADLASNAIRVRRSSDDAELDIGFDKYGNLDTQALLNFVGTGTGDTGYVTTWYDQSARGGNLTQTINSKQGVIIDDGQLVTTSDGARTISFNQGLNGSNNDWMSMSGTGGSATNIEMYFTYQYAATSNGTLVNIGTAVSTGRISVHSPWSTGITYWDAGSAVGDARLSAANIQTVNQVQQLVFTANYNHSGAGTLTQNKVDAKQAIFVDGEVKGADDNLLDSALVLGFTWYLATFGYGGTGFQSGMISEFLFYTNNSNTTVTDPTAFLGTAVNNTFTYAGETTLASIDGKVGYDTVILSGASSNLDTTTVALNSIELIHMRNGETNTLTINNTQLDTNVPVLSVLMDTGDSIVYEGTILNYSATQEVVNFGTTGNDTINMSSFNETVYGRGGNDTFVYKSWSDAAASSSSDSIADFTIGDTGAGNDTLNLKDLLSSYNSTNLTDFINLTESGGNTIINVGKNGAVGGAFAEDISITLTGVTGANLLTMITDGNLVLE